MSTAYARKQKNRNLNKSVDLGKFGTKNAGMDQTGTIYRGTGWLGTDQEQHHRGQQRGLEERLCYARSVQKGVEQGLIKSLHPKEFKKELLDVAIQKLQQRQSTNGQSVVLKSSDVASKMKTQLLKSRSITQPKLLTEHNSPSNIGPYQTPLEQTLPGITNTNTRFSRHKVSKSHFFTLNDKNNIAKVEHEASMKHVIPTAVCDKEAKGVKNKGHFDTRSRSTVVVN